MNMFMCKTVTFSIVFWGRTYLCISKHSFLSLILYLYTQRSLKILFIFVIPCFLAESGYKIWWYSSGGTKIAFLGNVVVSNIVACIFDLCSWFYRTVVFFLVCVLFRLLCYLQILRMQDFGLLFQIDSNVESVLKEHLRIRRHLRIISHRYRVFILWSLISISASQFASLLMTTRPNSHVNIYNAGELAVCKPTLIILAVNLALNRLYECSNGVV